MLSNGKIQVTLTLIIGMVLVVVNTAYSAGGNENKVDYPEGYRDWVHVKSMVIQQGHSLYDSFGGIHHIYANKQALDSLKNGKAFPDGAVLIFDLFEAKHENNAITEGSRKVVGVMQKNSRMFSETGGWGFEGFKGDSRERVVGDPAASCFNCHQSQEDIDFVFSQYRQ